MTYNFFEDTQTINLDKLLNKIANITGGAGIKKDVAGRKHIVLDYKGARASLYINETKKWVKYQLSYPYTSTSQTVLKFFDEEETLKHIAVTHKEQTRREIERQEYSLNRQAAEDATRMSAKWLNYTKFNH